MKKKAVIFLGIGLLAFGFQNCGGPGFESMEQSNSSGAGVIVPPLDQTLSGVLKVTAPSHVVLGECGPIIIELTDALATPAQIEIPADLSDKLFVNSTCEGPLVSTTPIASSELPKTVYFRSQSLFQGLISFKIGTSESNRVFLTNYKRKFMDVQKSIPASIRLQSNFNGAIRRFDQLPETADDFMNSMVLPSARPDQEIGDESLSNVSSFASLNGQYQFTKTKAYIGRAIIQSVAADVVGPTLSPGSDWGCYASMNDVFCREGSDVAGVTTVTKVGLPAGPLQDMAGQLDRVCVVKSGKVFCWGGNLVVQEITALGMNNSAVVIPGTICTISAGKAQCLIGAQVLDVGFTGEVRRIWAGPREPVSNIIMVQGMRDGQLVTEGKNINGTQTYTIQNPAEKFDEVYPVSFDSGIFGGCGRVGTALNCFRSSVNGPFGQPAVVPAAFLIR